VSKLRADAEAMRDRIVALDGELSVARTRAEESQARAEDAEKRAADLETRLAGTVEELEGVRSQLDGLRGHLEEVLATRTMRWTHHAREAYSGLRRLRSRLFRG
jgi:chromosome segregation ATPase